MMDLRNEVEPVVKRSDRLSKRLALLIAARFFFVASKFAYTYDGSGFKEEEDHAIQEIYTNKYLPSTCLWCHCLASWHILFSVYSIHQVSVGPLSWST
jgi:hypothetical protein